jgi:autotransporter translocation and assembly factor TamB
MQETVKRKYSLDIKLGGLGSEEPKIEISKAVLNLENAVFQNRIPIQIALSKDKASVSSFNLYHKENSVVGEFTFGYDRSVAGSLRLEKLSLPDVSEMLDVAFPVKGRMSGEIKIGSSLAHPDIRADISARDLEYKKFKSDQLTLALVYSGDKLGLNLDIKDNNEDVLTAVADATVKFDPEHMDKSIGQAAYKATIKSKGINISPLTAFNDEIQELDGKLAVDLVAEGTGNDPNITGRLELRDVTM